MPGLLVAHPQSPLNSGRISELRAMHYAGGLLLVRVRGDELVLGHVIHLSAAQTKVQTNGLERVVTR